MNVVISTEQRFVRTADGAIWTPNQCSYPFWTRYLDVFDRVRVIARVHESPEPPPKYLRADGNSVEFAAVPYYVGPWQYFRKSSAVRRAVHSAPGPQDAVIMRVGGSQLANCMFPKLMKDKRPFGVEVVGDPWDVFAPGVVKNPLRPALRWYFANRLRAQCAAAIAAAYVTEGALQHRYPLRAREGRMETTYSSVELPPGLVQRSVEMLKNRNHSVRESRSPDQPLTLILVGSLEQLYKGPDIALQALSLLRQGGVKVQLKIVGDGRFREQLEGEAAKLGIADITTFLGQLPSSADVCSELENSDLFIMPSRTEGLPRAMIEAMACGLPCIGTAVGGIPELLAAEDLIATNDARALADKIREIISDPARKAAMALRNLERSKDFQPEVLRERRISFLKFVRQRTEEMNLRDAVRQSC